MDSFFFMEKDRMKARTIASLLVITFALSGIAVCAGSSEIRNLDDFFLIGELYAVDYILDVCGISGVTGKREGDIISLSNGMEFTRNGRAVKSLDPLEFDDSIEIFQRTK